MDNSQQNYEEFFNISYEKNDSSNESLPIIRSLSSSSKNYGGALASGGKTLKRSLGFKHAFVFIVGILFGSGIFVSPALVARQTNNMGMAIVIWILAGIPCLFGALCYCELACMYGKSGGTYLFILEAYGNLAGFFTVWTKLLAMTPIGAAIVAVVIGENITWFFYDLETTEGTWLMKSVAILFVLIPALVNIFSVSFASKTQMIFTIVQTISVMFLIVLGAWQVGLGHTSNYLVMFNNTQHSFDFGSFGLAFYNALWSFEGWAEVTILVEELKNMKRNLWLSIITGIPFVIFFYALTNLAFISVLSHKEIGRSTTTATYFVEKILGRKASVVMPIAVALSSFACLNATIFVFPRMMLSAAREGQLPYALCFIHKNKRTPVVAIVTLFLLTAFYIVIAGNKLQSLLTIFSCAMWVQYFLAIFSVVLMRIRRAEFDRPFKVWLINPLFTSATALLLVIVPFMKMPVESSISFALMLSALPVYYIFILRHENLPVCVKNASTFFNDYLLAKFNLVPCIFEGESNTDNFVPADHL
eukprot:gene9701-biopygen8011